MASGHSSLSTIHADSVDTLIKRLETPPINLSPTLINTIDAVAIMTHALVNKQETRKLREIVEIVEVTPEGMAMTNTPLIWNAREDSFYFKKSSHVFKKISDRYGFTMEELEREFKIRTLIISSLASNKIFSFDKVQSIVNHYYKDPATVIQMFGLNNAVAK
jgi:flagellar protein FlaI